MEEDRPSVAQLATKQTTVGKEEAQGSRTSQPTQPHRGKVQPPPNLDSFKLSKSFSRERNFPLTLTYNMRCRWKIKCLPHNHNLKSDSIRADPYHIVHDTWRRLRFKHKTHGALGLTRGSDARVSQLTVAVRLGVLWGMGLVYLLTPPYKPQMDCRSREKNVWLSVVVQTLMKTC